MLLCNRRYYHVLQRMKNQGKNAQVKVQSSKMDDDGVLRFQVEFFNGTTESATREHLHRLE